MQGFYLVWIGCLGLDLDPSIWSNLWFRRKFTAALQKSLIYSFVVLLVKNLSCLSAVLEKAQAMGKWVCTKLHIYSSYLNTFFYLIAYLKSNNSSHNILYPHAVRPISVLRFLFLFSWFENLYSNVTDLKLWDFAIKSGVCWFIYRIYMHIFLQVACSRWLAGAFQYLQYLHLCFLLILHILDFCFYLFCPVMRLVFAIC